MEKEEFIKSLYQSVIKENGTKEIEISMTIEGIDEPLNGELQDLFLEYNEENR